MYLILDGLDIICDERFCANFKSCAAHMLYAGQYGVDGIKGIGQRLLPQNTVGFD